MKKILPLFIFILIADMVMAQITIDATSYEIIENDVDLTDPYYQIEQKYVVTNESSTTVDLVWYRELMGDCTATWTSQVCDNNLCYGPGSDTNDGVLAATLAPGESSDLLTLYVKPNGTPGCCNYRIHYFIDGNLVDTLGTVSFDVRVNDEQCLGVNSTQEELTAKSIAVFPNPMTDYFQLSGNEQGIVKELAVYNLVGRQVRSFDAANMNQFDMTGLPQGIYLVGMIGAQGDVLRTVRISRQVVQP